MVDLSGRVAFVAGGAGAIGRAVAGGLAGAGASVVLGDLSSEVDKTWAAIASEHNGPGRGVRVDLAEAGEVESVLTGVKDEFGRLDILIYAAGIFPRRGLLELPVEEWDRTQAVNLRGFFLSTKAAVAAMLPQEEGRIIGFASGLGVVGRSRGAAYASSKAAMVAFTRSVAAELRGTGITINCIGPGITESPMMRGANSEDEIQAAVRSSGRQVAVPADLVGPVLFLLGPAARTISGTTLWMCNPS